MPTLGEIILSPGRSTVTVREIPLLISLALHPEVPETSSKTVSQLQKQIDTSHAMSAPQSEPLTEDDWAVLNGIWSLLPSFREGLPEIEWGKYAEAFENAKYKPDWKLIVYWRGGALSNEIDRLTAEEEHKKAIPEAVLSGFLVVRSHSRIQIANVTGEQLQNGLVTVIDLRKYAARFNLNVRISDAVTIGALAKGIAEELADAYSQRWKKVESDNDLRRDIATAINVHGLKEVRVPGILQHIRQMTAQGFITPKSGFNGLPSLNPEEEIDDTWFLSSADAERVYLALNANSEIQFTYVAQEREKKKAGRFTLREAAKELADRTGWAIERWLAVMLQALKSGELTLKNPKDYSDPLPYGMPATIRDFYDEVSAVDLNRWLAKNLEWGVDFKFEENTSLTVPSKKSEPKQRPVEPLVSAMTHKIRNRSNALVAVITTAQTAASDPNDYHSVWAELVRLAESNERPSPLLGFVEDDGIKYQAEKEVRFFTKKNLSDRIRRANTR